MNIVPDSRRRKKKRHNLLIFKVIAFFCIGILIIIGSIIAYRIFSNKEGPKSIANVSEKYNEIPLDLENQKGTISSNKSENNDETKDPGSESVESISDNNVEVSFLDVGQGDATLIKQGEHAVLIDTGSENGGEPLIIEYLKNEQVTKLDYLIVTHGHEDHMGAGAKLIETLPIEHVICDLGNNEGYVEFFKNMLLEHKIDTIIPKEGQIINVGNFTIKVIMGRNEEIPKSDEEITNVNNQSIAIMIIHGDNKILFYGDGEGEYEKFLLESGKDIQANVLKIAHHGSAASSSDEILDKINPEFGIVSSAKQEVNGFPGDETLTRLGLHQITTFYTCQSGTIKMNSNGEKIEWITQK